MDQRSFASVGIGTRDRATDMQRRLWASRTDFGTEV